MLGQTQLDTLVTSRLYIPACRARREQRVEPWLFQHGGRQRGSSDCVYTFSLLSSGFASISGTISGKSEVDDMSTSLFQATPRNTCHASRARRDERVAPCCPTSATRLVTTFPQRQNA